MSGPKTGVTTDLVQEEDKILQTEGTKEHARRVQTHGAEAKELAEEQVTERRDGETISGGDVTD
jgi:hypothetical protein